MRRLSPVSHLVVFFLSGFLVTSALCGTRGKETSVPLYVPQLPSSKSGALSTFKENSLSAKKPVGMVPCNWHMGLDKDKR